MGKLPWEGARPDARRDEAVEIAWENFAGRERDSMLDGKPWKIAWGIFAGRERERDRMLDGMKPWKSLGETALGGSETGCWTG